MSIAQNMPGPVNGPQQAPHRDTGVSPSSSSPAHAAPEAALATLKHAARNSQVTRAALAILTELYTSTNAWQTFTVAYLASELVLSPETVSRSLRKLVRLHYLDERNAHRAHGERQARLATTTPTKGR